MKRAPFISFAMNLCAAAVAVLVATWLPRAASAQDDPPAGYDRATLTVLRWDPTLPNRVYAGTVGWGLVVSEDAGRTWSATAPQLGGRYIQSITVHPLIQDFVVAGTLRQGVWLSTDGGRSFARILTELPEENVPGVSLSLEAQPRTSEGTASDTGTETGGDITRLWALLRYRGPVRDDRLEPSPDAVIARMQPFTDISARPLRPDDVLVAGRGVVARTLDGGVSWTRVLDPRDARFRESPHFLRGIDPASCSVPFRFHRPPTQPDTVWLAACWGLYRSRDGGGTWEIVPLGGFGRVHAISADPTNPGALAVSTDLGLLRSQDDGANWEYVRAAAPGAPFQAIVMLPGGELLGGGFGGEVVRAGADGVVETGRLRDLQATQTGDAEEAKRRANRSTAPYDRAGLAARPEAKAPLRPGIDVHVADLAVHPNFPDRLFAGTRRGIFRSRDGGVTWQSSSLGLGEMEVTRVVVDRSAALIQPSGPDPAGERIMLWAATRGGGIYRSTSSGEAWQSSSDGLEDGVVRVLLQDRTEPHELWAGTADDGIYRSRDAGATWFASSDGLTEPGVRALVRSGGKLLAGTDGGQIFESIDDGDSWQPRGRLMRPTADSEQDLERFRGLGLEPQAMHIHDLLADESDPDRLLAASTFGVFRSDDGGETWEWTGLRRSVARLARHPYDEDRLYAATTRGLWWSQDAGKTWQQADFGRALNDLSLHGSDLDAAKNIRAVPPLFALQVLPNGDVLTGTDRGQVVRGKADHGGWRVAELARPEWIERPVGSPAPRKEPVDGFTKAVRQAYEGLREQRDHLLITSALAPDLTRRLSRPRQRVLLALEAMSRGEIPVYPPEVYEDISLHFKAELDKEDIPTRVLRLAQSDLEALKGAQLEGWGVETVQFGPLGRLLLVGSAVDNGRRTMSDLRVFDLDQQFLQSEEIHETLGPTPYWKVLHDLARKPQAAQPDWLLEDTGPLLFWRRQELLVTRPRDDRVAIWRLSPRATGPAPTAMLQPGMVRGFRLPVEAVSISDDGTWLGAVDRGGQAWWALLAGGREPHGIDGEVPYQQVHVTARQMILLGKEGIVAYRLGPDGPILTTTAGEDAGEVLFGSGAGFSEIVGDRQGKWMVAVPAPFKTSAQTLVLIAFRDGLAVKVHELDRGVDESWQVTASARQEWLAVRRASESGVESMLFGLRNDPADAAPELAFRVEDASGLRFGAGGEHVYFRADGEDQVWTLQGPAPRRVEHQVPNLPNLAGELVRSDPRELASWFFEDEPRRKDLGEWADHDSFGYKLRTSPDGRWMAVAGPGRLLRLWHFNEETLGNLAGWTGGTLLDLARFRPYPSNHPSGLDAWPEVIPQEGEPGGGEIWRDACAVAGRNLDQEEWRYLFGEEPWQATCAFE